MSLKAMLWALEQAPVNNPARVVLLVALADRASDDGTAAWPTVAWLAHRARCSERSVQRYLQALQDEDGVIRLGDQDLVAHIRRDNRPRVWDLRLDVTWDTAATRTEAREPAATGTTGRQADTPQPNTSSTPPTRRGDNLSPRHDERGDTAVTPSGFYGVTAQAPRGDRADVHGVTLLSPEPSYFPYGEVTVREPSNARERADLASSAEVTAVTSVADITARYVTEPSKLTAAQLEHLFDEFYDAYPRHTGRKAARLAYLKAVKGTKTSPGTHPAAVLHGAQRFAHDPGRADEFTPHPATWLNQGRWDDDPLPARRSQAAPGEKLAQVIALGRGIEAALGRNHPGNGPSSPASGPAAITGPNRTDEPTEALSAARRLRELEGGW